MSFRNNDLAYDTVTNTDGRPNVPVVSFVSVFSFLLQIIILASLCKVLPSAAIDFYKNYFSSQIFSLAFAFLIVFECTAISFLFERLLLLIAVILHLFKCETAKPFKILFVFYAVFCVLHRILFSAAVWLLIAAGGISWYSQGYTHPINYIFLLLFAAATAPLIISAVKIIRSKGANIKARSYFLL